METKRIKISDTKNINDEELKIVRQLEIKDKQGNIIDFVTYEFTF